MDADHIGTNERALAQRIHQGDVGAGRALCEMLSRKGPVTRASLVLVVADVADLTAVGFDTACDAFEQWTFARLTRDIPVPEGT